MELFMISYSLLLTLTLTFLLSKLIPKLTSQHHPPPRLPPGPRQLPIIGSLHHLLGSDLPHHRFRDLSHKFGPLIHLKLGEVSTLVASSPDMAQEIMKTHDIVFATRPLYDTVNMFSYGGKTVSFAPYGDYWRQLRKICVLELLSIKRVNSFRSIREEEVRNLVLSISSSSLSGSVMNLSKKITAMINNISGRVVIGNRCEEQSDYLEALDEMIGVLGGFNLADVFPTVSGVINMVSGFRAKRSYQKINRILDMILKQHREERRLAKIRSTGSELQVDQEENEGDLVNVLLRLQEDKSLQCELTDDCIKAIIADMFGAGTETSSTALQWTMSELLINPKVMKKVQSEVREAFKGQTKISEANMHTGKLKYLHLVVKETLRLHPPVPLLLPRECQKACKLLEYEIPEKTQVMVNAWAIGRDPEYWEDAEEFKPERFEEKEVDFKGANFELLPFGAGRRMCPAMMVALLNVEFPLAEMLYYFDWELPGGVGGGSLDMREAFGITARRKSDLCLNAISRIPCSTA